MDKNELDMSHLTELYIKDLRDCEPIDKEKEKELALRMKKGDVEARNTLVKSQLRFVVNMAKKYKNKGFPLADIINEGNLGLILACKNFDPNMGYRFSSYARWWIKQYISKAFAEKESLIRLPMNRALQHYKIRKLHEENPDLSIDDQSFKDKITQHLDINEKDISLISAAKLKHQSLDQAINVSSDSKVIPLIDLIEDENSKSPENLVDEIDLKDDINKLLDTLSDKERNIINYRFGLNGLDRLSLSQIGKIFNVSKERIRQIEKRALNKLKNSPLNNSLKIYVAA